MVYRQFVSDVETIVLDGNGRFLIPKRYLKMANIDQQIKFIGMDDCIEIWNNENEDAYLEPDDFSETLEAIMGKSGGTKSTRHRHITQVEVMVKNRRKHIMFQYYFARV